MTDKLLKFLEAASADRNLQSELKEKIRSAAGKNLSVVAAAFAREKGYELEETDLVPAGQELDQDELAAVTGGGGCGCVAFGMGGGDGIDCICEFYGEGTVDDAPGVTDEGGCICVGGGAGATNRK